MVPPMSIATRRALRFYSIDRAGFFHRRRRIVGARFLSRLPFTPSTLWSGGDDRRRNGHRLRLLLGDHGHHRDVAHFSACSVLAAPHVYGLWRGRDPHGGWTWTACGGALPAFIALAGLPWIYLWLELPYSKLPAITLHGVNINFIIEYPVMRLGTLTVMSAFALASRNQESRVMSRVAESAVAGD
jgi:hypothetical protein